MWQFLVEPPQKQQFKFLGRAQSSPCRLSFETIVALYETKTVAGKLRSRIADDQWYQLFSFSEAEFTPISSMHHKRSSIITSPKTI
jgi:hypothetical protein